MPLDQNQLNTLNNIQLAQPPPGDFGVPKPQTPDQQVNDLPNAQKLTKFERGVYGALPGVTTWMNQNKIMGRTISEQLDKFNGSLVGKALNSLDVFAEGLERTSGLAAQMLRPDWNSNELKAAWYAGSLTYDVSNLPELIHDPITGAVTGMRMSTDLPGVDGLAKARSQIQALLNQGLDPKEALAKVRDDTYNGLGALALRAQLHDLGGHVLLDPLNVIMGELKPIEALKATRFEALTTKFAGGAEEVLAAADKAAQLAGKTTVAEDSLKLLEEAATHAQTAGNLEKSIQYTQQAAEAAQGLGQTAKYEELTKTLETLGKTAANADEAANYSERALQALGKKQLTTYDKFAIMLTGGDPFRPSALGKKLEKVPGLGTVAKAFQLTPESKAKELMTLLSDNIGTNVISRLMDHPNAEAEFTSYIRRVSAGATGSEYGHGLLTLEGKTVQGFVSGVDTNVSQIHDIYQALEPQRNMLEIVSQSLGENPEKILQLAQDDPATLMNMLGQKAQLLPELGQAIQQGSLSEDALKSMAKVIGDNPYNKEMFFAQAMDAIETHAMRQAVLQFGVQSKGQLTRWSEAMKAAESLAFLKLNPAYPIRNAINNEVTMLARGLFGFDSPESIGKFWEEFGATPARFGELSLGSEAQAEKLTEAQKILNNALNGGEYSLADKAKEFFQKLNVGKLDATKWGGFEVKAGQKAYTLGTRQYLHEYYNPTGLREYIQPKVLDEIANTSPEFERTFNNAIRSSQAMQGKFEKLLGENLNLNVDSILDDVADHLGVDVRQQLGSEALQHIHDNLPEALKNGTLEDFRLKMRNLVENHQEDLFKKQLENVIEHVKSQAAGGGPNVWHQKLAEANDIFWNAHIEHSLRMPELTRAATEASASGNYKLANILWKQEAEDSRLFYDRAFRRVDAYIFGLEQGSEHLAEQGAKLPFKEVRNTFNRWKGMWSDFHGTKNNLYEEFFNAVNNGEKRNITDVQNKVSQMYRDSIAKEDEFMRQIDDHVAGMLDNPEIRKAFTRNRDALAEMRQTDKRAVVDLFEQVNQAPPEQRQEIFNQFFQERFQRLHEMKNMDSLGLSIQQGDPQALNMFGGSQPAAGIFGIANEYGVPNVVEGEYARNEKRILNTVNMYAADFAPKYKSVSEIPEEVARKAFEEQAKTLGAQLPPKAEGVNPQFIAEHQKVIPDPQPLDMSLDLVNYGRVKPMIDEVVRGAQAAAEKTPTLLGELPQHLQGEVRKAVELAKNDMAAARYNAMKFGEWRRDSALLNYNRRTNFDNWLGHIAPFSFWTTGSMASWSVNSIDRPAMLTNYLRTKKFMATAGLQRTGVATRSKGKFRIALPFAPAWMGEQFIDPMRTALPFDNWLSPFEQLQKSQQTQQGQITRLLDQQLQDGQITQAAHDQAVNAQSGPAWDYASNRVQENSQSDNYDAFDFATAMASPHAPLMWAYNAAFGHKEDIGPFAPASRLFRNAATLMGVEDWNNSQYNVEAKIRKQLGLPAFDKWDNYRIDRALSDMAGDGSATPDDVKEAMAVNALVQQGKMTPAQAKAQYPVYAEGIQRSNQEFTGGPLAAALGLVGMSVTSIPQGENNLRSLQNDFGLAYQQFKGADDSLNKYLDAHPEMDQQSATAQWEKMNPKLADDAGALKKFFDDHPEYETRLGLFDPPEKRLHKFMMDQLWKKYNAMPDLNKKELRDGLGQDFQDSFINPDTRNYDSITQEKAAVWLKLMGADPLGGLTADQDLLVSLYGQIKYTDPETSNRVQTFYDYRKSTFPDFYKKQNDYYSLPQAQRKAYLTRNPDLRQYFDWRKNFMTQNPDLVVYLTDNQRAIDKAKTQTRSSLSVPTANEIKANFSPPLQRILAYSQQQGEPLPYEAQATLDELANQYNISTDELLAIFYAGGQ